MNKPTTTDKYATFAAILLTAALLYVVFVLPAMYGQHEPLAAPFTDTQGHPYEWAIEEIRLAGITAGCGDGMFCPDRPLTRGEAAVMLAKMLER